MFIIDIKYTADLSVIDQHLVEHRNYLDTKYKEGILLCSGPKTPRTGGIVIAICKTIEEVETYIQNDPFFKHKVATYSVTEFTPVKHHTSIEQLC
jgi:uncharacterized protein YciI